MKTFKLIIVCLLLSLGYLRYFIIYKHQELSQSYLFEIILFYAIIITIIDVTQIKFQVNKIDKLTKELKQKTERIEQLEALLKSANETNKKHKDLFSKVASSITPEDHKIHYVKPKNKKQDE